MNFILIENQIILIGKKFIITFNICFSLKLLKNHSKY